MRSSRRPRGRLWEGVRRAVLERDGFSCRRCGRTGRMEVDHIMPLHIAIDNSMENLQTLCLKCHWKKTDGEMGWDRKESRRWRAYLVSLTT